MPLGLSTMAATFTSRRILVLFCFPEAATFVVPTPAAVTTGEEFAFPVTQSNTLGL